MSEDAPRRAEDRNKIQTERHHAPKNWSGNIAQPHYNCRGASDGGVDNRNGQQVSRQITLDMERDFHRLALIGECRQNLNKPTQESLSEYEEVEQDEKRLQKMSSNGTCATEDRRDHANRAG
jgi:hypothetical protein